MPNVEIESLKPLTIRQVNMLRGMKDPDESNIVAISLSARMDKADVAEWYDDPDRPAGDVLAVVKAVFEVSGMGEAARFQG